MKRVFIAAMLCTSMFAACKSSSDDGSTIVEKITLVVTEVSASDFANNANGTDVRVSFNKPSNASEVDEYRVILSKNTLSLEEAIALNAARYFSINKTATTTNVTLSASLLDAEGNPLQENTTYNIYVLSVVPTSSTTTQSGLSAPAELTLTKTDLATTLAMGFDASGGITLGSDGSIYAANFGTGASNGTKILKFSPDGSSVLDFADGLLGPTNGAFDTQGDLYWSSYSDNKVKKIDTNGNVSDFAEIAGPVSITFNQNNEMFVASCNGNVINKVASNGTVTEFATHSDFNCINGIGFTPNGDMYACNYEDGKVFKITPDGTVSSFATISSGSSDNLAIGTNHLYITGRKAHEIYAVSIADGTVSVIAGTGERGHSDGPALTAKFSFPSGMVISADKSKLYVTEVSPNSGSNANGPNFNPNILRVISLDANR